MADPLDLIVCDQPVSVRSDRVAVVDRGEIVERDDAEQVATAPRPRPRNSASWPRPAPIPVRQTRRRAERARFMERESAMEPVGPTG